MRVEVIEQLVRERKTAAAQRAIQLYLKKEKAHGEAIFQACDWYRRLGLYRQGFLLLAPSEPLRKPTAANTEKGQRFLWAARLLNLLGGSVFALELIEQLEPVSAQDYRSIGNIYLSNSVFDRAYRSFLKASEIDSRNGDQSYAARLGWLGVSDALAELNRHDEAIEIIKKVIAESREPLLLAISNQALGEVYARNGDYEKALIVLRSAEGLFPPNEKTSDVGFLFKWLGWVLAKQGERTVSARYFNKAEAILRNPELRPEAWLDLLRLKSEVGMLSEKERDRLVAFPGTSKAFRRLLSEVRAMRFGPASALIRIRFDSNEYQLGSKCYLGLPRELILLGWLRIVGSWGLQAVRAQSVIWRGEVYSFTQLEGRMHQLLLRIRRVYGCEVSCRDGVLLLDKAAYKNVSVRHGSEMIPVFLQQRSRFCACELSGYYSLRKTQRAKTIHDWLERGWISREGSGNRVRYRVARSGA